MPEATDATSLDVEKKVPSAHEQRVGVEQELEVETYARDILGKLVDQQKIYVDTISKLRKENQQKLRGLEKFVNDEIDKMRRDIERLSGQETKVIETLGIFVALFTFISINIQIFSRVSDLLGALIFSTILAGLTVFIITTITLVTRIHDTKDTSWLLRFILLLILSGLFIISGFALHFWLKPQLNPNNDKKIDVQVTQDQKTENSEETKGDTNNEMVR